MKIDIQSVIIPKYQGVLEYWTSRTGDGWFLNKIDNTIFHYNHDTGEYTKSGFTNLGIDFSQFVQLALLYRDLERLLDEGETLTDNIKTEFIYSVNSISNNLFDVYPFKYF